MSFNGVVPIIGQGLFEAWYLLEEIWKRKC